MTECQFTLKLKTPPSLCEVLTKLHMRVIYHDYLITHISQLLELRLYQINIIHL